MPGAQFLAHSFTLVVLTWLIYQIVKCSEEGIEGGDRTAKSGGEKTRGKMEGPSVRCQELFLPGEIPCDGGTGATRLSHRARLFLDMAGTLRTIPRCLNKTHTRTRSSQK